MTQRHWIAPLGAWPEPDGIRFRVWAPQARRVELVLEPAARPGQVYPLSRSADGYWGGLVAQARVGDRYRYRVDGAGPFPDPASRYQPEGVHGPSQVIDPAGFAWTDHDWPGLPLEQAVIYELHVGTFTEPGSFEAARQRLPELVELGVTAIELMPLADFPGQRNWGYDGVSLFAPARCYGTPDDLRRLIDTAHRLGLAVLLDVVYNHLGPDGNYLRAFSPAYYAQSVRNPWGDGLNFDGPNSGPVREFFIHNALHWLHEYHFDGLRLDATHAVTDTSPRHFFAELAQRVRASLPHRSVLLIAEDERNLNTIPSHRSPLADAPGAWGMDAVWADDLHHQLRRLLAGDCEGYYSDYTGTTADLAQTIRQGWFYRGQYSPRQRAKRGTDPTPLAPPAFVVCLQNHDQVGNRAFGERLHHQIDLASYRAASVLLLSLPQTPLLFMGQEWACTSPFLFFTDHHTELGQAVTQGRRREFGEFAAFADPASQARIPDPQAWSTFQASVLDWQQRQRPPHQGIWRLYQAMLRLRRCESAMQTRTRADYDAAEVGEDTVIVRRQGADGQVMLVVARLRGQGDIDLRGHPLAQPGPALAQPGPARTWQVLLHSEQDAFTDQPQPPRVQSERDGLLIQFVGPAALVLAASATS